MNPSSAITAGQIIPPKRVLFTSFIALIAGGFIYMFLRPAPAVFFTWLEPVGLESLLRSSRTFTLKLTPFLPGWLIYNLPQGLWAFAYTLIITGIWGRHRSAVALFWLATIPLLTLGFEGLQYAGLIRGTFCLNDMLFSVGGIIVVIFLESFRCLYKNNLS